MSHGPTRRQRLLNPFRVYETNALRYGRLIQRFPLPFSMPGWTLVEVHPSQGRTFRHPLSVSEQGFFWDGTFNGTTDSIHHFELRLQNARHDAHVFSNANIVRAWVSTKQRYPLVGAIVQGQDEGVGGTVNLTEDKTVISDDGTKFTSAQLHYVVRERDLSALRPREIVFGQVANVEDARRQTSIILGGPRSLSKNLLVQLYVFREKARADVLHLMTLEAHCVADWVADWMLVRHMMVTLARDRRSSFRMPLEDRLRMEVPMMELRPSHLGALTPARQRWRWAVGLVIHQLRLKKMQGGHTLPCRLMRSTPQTSAPPDFQTNSLTRVETMAVMTNCHRHKITFGNALTVLTQVAMTRVLYRRYLRGEISDEEWEFRKRQPHLSGSPINLRPYLDQAWLKRGGGSEFMLATGFFVTQLPFMTLGETDYRRPENHHALSNGAPSFPDLLAFDRFLHRVGLIKKQAALWLSHPLFFEIMHAGCLEFSQRQQLDARERTKGIKTPDRGGEDEVLAATNIPLIWACMVSSLNVDPIFPSEYPYNVLSSEPVSRARHGTHSVPSLPITSKVDMRPTVAVEYAGPHLHIRPAELYLCAFTFRGMLDMRVFYDGNVFEEEVVGEWLHEVKGAVLWYLGRCNPDFGRDGLGRGAQARL